MEDSPDAHFAPVRNAAVIAGLTAASRAAGLVRTLVATSVLGITFLGNIYASSNAVPNLLFEIVAGGALAAALVPSISAALAEGDREEVAHTASSFLSWTILLLSPVVLVAVATRGLLMESVTSRVPDLGVRAAQRELGEFLLVLFLPQIWLYGIGVVLTGVLHAHKRFAGPALAPLLSSVVVTASYVLYAVVEGPSATKIGEVSTTGRLILGLGTTAGVAVLTLSLMAPVRKLRIGWRPTLRIPLEAWRTTRRLLGSAIVAVAAQQTHLGVVVVIANSVEGGVVAYQLAFTMLLLPWAVLALPLATATFPGLAEAASSEDGHFGPRFAEGFRNVTFVVFGGAGMLFAVAGPLSYAISSIGIGSRDAAELMTYTLAAFAPGLVGYGLYAFLTRASYALREGRSPAIAALAGFGSSTLGSILAASLLEGRALVGALAGSFSAGMLVGVFVLLKRLKSIAGGIAFEGLGASGLRGLGAGAIASAGGIAIGAVIPTTGAAEFLTVVVIAIVSPVIYLAVQRLLGDRQLPKALVALRGP